MSASLVGSEMCIRDSLMPPRPLCTASGASGRGLRSSGVEIAELSRGIAAVSYTHLTLPTICSV
eukprot:2582744-Alexandrium_andersonii.AAC.1